jgi:hypothetical protein
MKKSSTIGTIVLIQRSDRLARCYRTQYAMNFIIIIRHEQSVLKGCPRDAKSSCTTYGSERSVSNCCIQVCACSANCKRAPDLSRDNQSIESCFSASSKENEESVRSKESIVQSLKNPMLFLRWRTPMIMFMICNIVRRYDGRDLPGVFFEASEIHGRRTDFPDPSMAYGPDIPPRSMSRSPRLRSRTTMNKKLSTANMLRQESVEARVTACTPKRRRAVSTADCTLRDGLALRKQTDRVPVAGASCLIAVRMMLEIRTRLTAAFCNARIAVSIWSLSSVRRSSSRSWFSERTPSAYNTAGTTGAVPGSPGAVQETRLLPSHFVTAACKAH